jgi:hypothetical protein
MAKKRRSFERLFFAIRPTNYLGARCVRKADSPNIHAEIRNKMKKIKKEFDGWVQSAYKPASPIG